MKKVCVLGKGKSAESASVLLKKMGLEFFALSSDEFEKIFNKAELLNSLLFCVVSPGVPYNHKVIKFLKKNNIKVIPEVELAFCYTKVPVVAITGTDGKTTTTKLVEHIAEDCLAVGNVGVGFCEKVAGEDVFLPKAYVCETSSFMCEAFNCFAPKIACILNIAPDHIDRHNTLKAYLQAKLRVFEFQGKTDFAIINADDETLMKATKTIKSKKYFFSLNKEVKGCFVRGNSIYFKDKKVQEVLNLDTFVLKEKHNKENLLCAVLCALLLNVPISKIAERVKTFEPLPHRFNLIGSAFGVDFIDASKATSVHSAIACLNCLTVPTVVMVGGSSKNEDYAPLFDALPRLVKKLIICGNNAEQFVRLASKMGVPFEVCEDFEVAERMAFSNAKSGEAVALIPASASFDRFSSYKQRGETFERIFQEIKNGESFFKTKF